MKLIFLRKIGKIWILNKKDYITFLCLFMIHNFTNYTASSSVQFSRSVVSDSLQPHGLQHTRSPRLSPTPGTYSNYVHHIGDAINHLICRYFCFCLQSFPASRSFLISQFFASGGQIIGVPASASVVPMNIPDWFPLGWTGCIFLLSKRLTRVFSNITVQKHQFFGTQVSLQSNSNIPQWLLEKT